MTPREKWVIKINESLGSKSTTTKKKKVNWIDTQVKGYNGCQIHKGINLQKVHRKPELIFLKI